MKNIDDREKWFCMSCNETYYRDDAKDHQYCNLTDKELKAKIIELEDSFESLSNRLFALESNTENE